jgi:hypothetical protein
MMASLVCLVNPCGQVRSRPRERDHLGREVLHEAELAVLAADAALLVAVERRVDFVATIPVNIRLRAGWAGSTKLDIVPTAADAIFAAVERGLDRL